MVHILPAPTHIDADQMSPIRAADPGFVAFGFAAERTELALALPCRRPRFTLSDFHRPGDVGGSPFGPSGSGGAVPLSLGSGRFAFTSQAESLVEAAPVVRRGAPWCAVVRRGAPWCAVVRRGAPWCAVV